jgi:hypothetical protein
LLTVTERTPLALATQTEVGSYFVATYPSFPSGRPTRSNGTRGTPAAAATGQDQRTGAAAGPPAVNMGLDLGVVPPKLYPMMVLMYWRPASRPPLPCGRFLC